MQHTKIKRFILLLGLILPIAWCNAKGTLSFDEYSHIAIKERVAQDAPRGSSIQASINGHVLTVVFTENLGQVAVEVSTAVGTLVHYSLTPTPNGVQMYILDTGDFIITFTLSNGDEYYGEFTVTD